MRYAVTASKVITPTQTLENAFIVVDGGTVEQISERASAEVPSGIPILNRPCCLLAPGFIDIHIHGAAGHDCMTPDVAGFREMCQFLAKHGVTSFLPTTVTSSREKLLRSMRFLAAQIAEGARQGEAQPIGIHLEGPFISKSKAGVHPLQEIMPPSIEFLDELIEASGGHIRLITVAPETEGALEFIAHAVGRGIRVSIGHSDATFSEALAAIEHGATHATHTFNAMRAFDHREPGILGAVLSDQRVTAELILDFVHVHEAAAKLFFFCKGRRQSVLVTDGISATGMPDGKYSLGSFEVEVSGLRCLSGGRLAGSVLTLDRALQNAIAVTSWPVADAIALVTSNPAKMLGVQASKGNLRVSGAADYVVLSPLGEIQGTCVAGTALQNLH